MKLNIDFLQTGGVPLTNDLMANIMEALKLYDVLGDIAGHLTILSGCTVIGSVVSPGIVAINGEVLVFEGGGIFSTVFINEEKTFKTFEDQTSKILIVRKTVKFGNANTSYSWADFVRLETLKVLQDKINKAATNVALEALEKRVEKVELKTAPIVNGGIVWIWNLPVADIPLGWKECTNLKGKTVFGFDANDPDFSTLGSSVGNKKTVIIKDNLPNLTTSFGVIQPYEGVNTSGGFDGGGNIWKNKSISINPGGNSKPLSVLNPGRIANFIEPNFQ